MKILIAALITTCLLFINCSAQQSKHRKAILLKTDCFFDKQNRKVVDSLTNKIALVSKQGSYSILTINKKKYLPCNLPNGLEGKKILISAYILQEFETEKIIATPLRLLNATLYN